MSTTRESHRKLSVSNTSGNVPSSHLLPEEIVLSILKLLPVKSILRFKCVSKDWLSLLSSPNFISIHLQETFKAPLNDSFIIRCNYQAFLLNFNSIEREPLSLVNLVPEIFMKMYLVGSINGLLCLGGSRQRGSKQTVILWNPAMNLHKAIRLPFPDENNHTSSLTFAYDSVNDDYKIIRIDSFKPKIEWPETLSAGGFYRSHAEVYSATWDSWKRVHIDFPVCLDILSNNVILNGIPYWFSFHRSFLMYYDMQSESFKHVSLPEMGRRKAYVDWKGNLGMIVFSPSIDREDFVDILVYDETGMCCNKISHGPVTNCIKDFWPIQCSKDGVIVASTLKGKLMLYYPVANGLKESSIPGGVRYFPQAYTYTESLVTVEGMEQVKEQGKDAS